jgi:hypothetical protein
MPDILTVDDLVRETRAQVDESNKKTKSDADIVDVLNRGQRIVTSLLARRYPEPLLKETPLALLAGTTDYSIPEDSYENRVLHLTTRTSPGYDVEIRQRSYRDLTRFMISGLSTMPSAWAVVGRKIRILPAPTSGVTGTLTYIRRPPKLVLSQGRVTKVGADYVIVNETGDDVSSSMDELASYVSIINWSTGEVRASFQVQSVTGNKLAFAATPTRSEVRGVPISGASALTTCGAEVDDFICLAEGSCISYFQDSMSTYLVAYAASQLRLSLEGQNQLETAVEQYAKEALEHQALGRQGTAQVRFTSAIWSTYGSGRRFPTSSS